MAPGLDWSRGVRDLNELVPPTCGRGPMAQRRADMEQHEIILCSGERGNQSVRSTVEDDSERAANVQSATFVVKS